MIKFKLGVLLSQMGYRQDDVAKATKISKNTLSNIVNNKTSGIQNENLQKIALFLDVDISELFEYYPVMYSFSSGDIQIQTIQSPFDDAMSSLLAENKKCLTGITLNLTKSSLTTTKIPLLIAPLKNDGSFGVSSETPYIALVSSYSVDTLDNLVPDFMSFDDPSNRLNHFLKYTPITFLPDVKSDLQKFIRNEVIAKNDNQWSELFPNKTDDIQLLLGGVEPNKQFIL